MAVKKRTASLESVDLYFFLLRLLTIIGGSLYYFFTAHEYSAAIVFAWLFPLYVLYSALLYAGILWRPDAVRLFYLISLVVDLALIAVLILFVGMFVGSFYIGFYLLVAIHSFYFGLRVGMMSAVAASLIYSYIYVIFNGYSLLPWPDFLVRLGFLFLIALSLGLLAKNEKRQQETLAQALTRASQSARLKEEFLATLSHDVRTPLTNVVGYADILLGGTYGELVSAQREALEKIIRSAEGSLNLFTRILEFSRAKSADICLKVEAFDLGRLLGDMIKYFRPLSPNAGVEIRFHPPGHPVVVQSDRTLVCQVFSNLLTNALKYTEQGHVQVSLLNGDPTRGVRIIIEDTGIGIRPDEIGSIFDEFTKTSDPVAQEKGGAGLGLAIVKKALNHLSGEIAVESAYRKGSRFTVTLPIEIQESKSG